MEWQWITVVKSFIKLAPDKTCPSNFRTKISLPIFLSAIIKLCLCVVLWLQSVSPLSWLSKLKNNLKEVKIEIICCSFKKKWQRPNGSKPQRQYFVIVDKKQQFKRNQLWNDLFLTLKMINKFETQYFNTKILIFFKQAETNQN